MENSQQFQLAEQSQQFPQNAFAENKLQRGVTLRILNLQLSYKNQLQQYAQRSGLDLPVYLIHLDGEAHAIQFKCSVTVDDETYESPNTFGQKKAAEQDAAKYALKCILKKRQEKGSSILSKHTILCKAVLNEFAVKLQVERPKYNTVQTQVLPLPIFVSTLEFRGVSYTGGPARTKKDAEQLVAHDVTLSILGNSEEDSTLLEILRSKANLFTSTQSSLDPCCDITPVEAINSAGSDCLTLLSSEEQFKDANKASFSTQTQVVPDPPIQNPVQTFESSSLSNASVVFVPTLSQKPITPQLQVFANESCEIAPAPQDHKHVNSSMIIMSAHQNQECNAVSAPSLEVPAAVSPNQDCSMSYASECAKRLSRNQRKKANKKAKMANHEEQLKDASESPSSIQTEVVSDPPLQNPVQTFSTESPSFSDAWVVFVPSLSQKSKTPQIQVSANEGCKITPAPQNLQPVTSSMIITSAHQVDSSIFPGPPPNQECNAVSAPQLEASAVVAPNPDFAMSCASESAKRLSRSQRRRANKKAKMAD